MTSKKLKVLLAAALVIASNAYASNIANGLGTFDHDATSLDQSRQTGGFSGASSGRTAEAILANIAFFCVLLILAVKSNKKIVIRIRSIESVASVESVPTVAIPQRAHSDHGKRLDTVSTPSDLVLDM